jgi:hypothetical protein
MFAYVTIFIAMLTDSALMELQEMNGALDKLIIYRGCAVMGHSNTVVSGSNPA